MEERNSGKYEEIRNEVRYETQQCEDADYVIVASVLPHVSTRHRWRS